jgi:ribosomal protein L11 methyltransferase
MAFTVITAKVHPETLKEPIMAELSSLNYDAFLETDDGFVASVATEAFLENETDEVFGFYSAQGELSYTLKEVPKENWNKLWESYYDMVAVGNTCLIRAPFHQPDKTYPYELIIIPKMSFGTGHHATTQLMIEQQLETLHTSQKVFDAGSGTGILAIMAAKLGAAKVIGCDIEEWAIENARENAGTNSVTVEFYLGTSGQALGQEPFGLVLANINKSIILEELPIYHQLLAPGGYLITSGFYEEDVPNITQRAHEFNLVPETQKSRNRWASLKFHKPS